MYHFIGTPCKNKYYLKEQDFVAQISLLEELQIQSFCFDNDIDSNNNPICLITFDDGHKSNLWAAQLLKEKGLKGVFYVVKDFSLNNPDYLSKNDIKAISEMGHLIGVHGKDHEWWKLKNDAKLVAELKETKEWIENITGKNVVTCSAPGGGINSKVIKNIKKNFPEFKYIRTSRCGINNMNDVVLNSICIYNDTTLKEFQQIVIPNVWLYLRLGVIYYLKECLKMPYFSIKRLLGLKVE